MEQQKNIGKSRFVVETGQFKKKVVYDVIKKRPVVYVSSDYKDEEFAIRYVEKIADMLNKEISK